MTKTTMTHDDLIDYFTGKGKPKTLKPMAITPARIKTTIRELVKRQDKLASGIERMAVAQCLLIWIKDTEQAPTKILDDVFEGVDLSKVQKSHIRGGFRGIVKSGWQPQGDSYDQKAAEAIYKARTTNQRDFNSAGMVKADSPAPAKGKRQTAKAEVHSVNQLKKPTEQTTTELLKKLEPLIAELSSRAHSGDRVAAAGLEKLITAAVSNDQKKEAKAA